ncbi:MAG: Stealth CR1 domain-containing protein, partial [Flavobacterium sp.]|nr:Stealth CR1 domain-containing protein [Flavobacterium sp.]
MSVEIKNTNAIDAVITWVDGSDAVWRDKINTHLEKKIDWDNKISSKRYNSIDEIDLAIESIIKFAPFIGTIFL